MGKKHKLKKYKLHSRDVKDETDGVGTGKMKVIFRVPPPQPSSPLHSDPSFVVSLPLEEIARARHYIPEEGEATPTRSHQKKHKKKHHRHKPPVLTPPTLLNSSTSDRDDDEIDVGRKNVHLSRPYGSGKDLNFHKMSGKERSHQRVQAGPFLEPVDDEEGESEQEMEENTGGKKGKEISSLPVEINLDMVSFGSKKRPRNGGKEMRPTKIPKTPSSSIGNGGKEMRPTKIPKTPSTSVGNGGKEMRPTKIPKTPSTSIGNGGKEMRPTKILKTDSVGVETTPPRIIQTLSINSPLLITSSPPKTSSMDLLAHNIVSDEGERKKKKKKKHKHRHVEGSPLKIKKMDDSVKSSPEVVTPNNSMFVNSSMSKVISPILSKQQQQQQQQQHDEEEDTSLSSDVIMHEPLQDLSQTLLPRQTLSPADSTSLSVPSPSSSSSSRLHGVKLPRSALRYFLKHLHHQIQRNDHEGVFAEPVTDDIAPGYSNIIKQSMDLQTMAAKIDSNSYSTVDEFKEDFVLMCNNAMIYNTPETQYYQFSKQLLNFGLKLIQKEMSVRPDIRHGLIPSNAVSPQPPSSVPVLAQPQVDYSSPFLCKLDLSSLKPSSSSSRGGTPQVGGSDSVDESSVIDVSDELIKEHVDQSHLTQVQVGFDKEGETSASAMFQQNDKEMNEEEILQQVDQSYIEMKENMDANTLQPDLSFLSEDESGKTTLHILNPDSVPPCPVNLNVLADKVKAGDNASTVLATELPIFKATPVSYLMYGPFGSFAPTYDTSFANLTKHDSSLLLSTYGNEVGVNYANSLQQFVKGCGNFAMEMADAILNSLTNGRHVKFVESVKKEEKTSEAKVDTVEQLEEDKEKQQQQQQQQGDVSRQNEQQDDVMSDTVEGVNDIVIEKETGSDALDELTDSLEHNPVNAEDSLSHTSQLLVKLETEQNDRLSQPPQISTQTGEYILVNPTDSEMDTASEVSTELVSLTAKVNPSDVSTIPSLHNAMGMSHLTTPTMGMSRLTTPTTTTS